MTAVALGCRAVAAVSLGDWIEGRATLYDGPQDFKETFADDREGGITAWGDVFGGSCGYVDRSPGEVQSNADFPFELISAAAISTLFPEYQVKNI